HIAYLTPAVSPHAQYITAPPIFHRQVQPSAQSPPRHANSDSQRSITPPRISHPISVPSPAPREYSTAFAKYKSESTREPIRVIRGGVGATDAKTSQLNRISTDSKYPTPRTRGRQDTPNLLQSVPFNASQHLCNLANALRVAPGKADSVVQLYSDQVKSPPHRLSDSSDAKTSQLNRISTDSKYPTPRTRGRQDTPNLLQSVPFNASQHLCNLANALRVAPGKADSVVQLYSDQVKSPPHRLSDSSDAKTSQLNRISTDSKYPTPRTRGRQDTPNLLQSVPFNASQHLCNLANALRVAPGKADSVVQLYSDQVKSPPHRLSDSSDAKTSQLNRISTDSKYPTPRTRGRQDTPNLLQSVPFNASQHLCNLANALRVAPGKADSVVQLYSDQVKSPPHRLSDSSVQPSAQSPPRHANSDSQRSITPPRISHPISVPSPAPREYSTAFAKYKSESTREPIRVIRGGVGATGYEFELNALTRFRL
ncbi:hypothetical protein C8R47DRAFT_1082758, partial [Mycena vitilis]